MKRLDYISWDEYFMAIAKLSSYRSKDPSTRVGACIVDSKNRILSIGYNGAPNGFCDDYFPWERNGDMLNTKYAFVCHGEMNAILNYHGNVEGCTLYVTLFPCNECAKAVIQAGIKNIVYLEDKYEGTPSNVVAKKLLDSAGIKYKKYEKLNQEINLSL